MKKINLRLLAALLSVIMILGCSNFIITAEDSPEITENEQQEQISENAEVPSELVTEDETLRDKFTKHYVAEDGKRYAVVYADQIHYEDNNGNWLEVDNSLTFDTSKQKYSTNNTESSVFEASFAPTLTQNGELVSVSDGEYTVSWSLSFSGTGNMQMTMNANASIVNPIEPESKTLSNMSDMGKAVSSVRYNSVYSDTDVRYSLSYGKVEEDIILNSKSGFTSYMMIINTDGLTAVKNADGSIDLNNESGETVFNIASPWMKDSAGKYSGDIEVELIQRDDTAYIIYTPNAEWLNDTERVYPVLIDPSFTTRYYTSNYEDAYVSSEAPSTNFSDTQTLYAGNNNGIEYTAFVDFVHIPDLPSNTLVNALSLSVTAYNPSYSNINISIVCEDWWEGSVTYNSMPESDSLLYQYYDEEVLSDTLQYIVDIDIDTLFEWASDCFSYDYYLSLYDFLKGENFLGFAFDSNGFLEICGGSDPTLSFRPCLTIEYEIPAAPGIMNNGIYSFRNVSSDKYLTVDGGSTQNNTLTYHIPKYSDSNTGNPLSQEFRLIYNSNTGVSVIRSMLTDTTNGSVLDYAYNLSMTDTGYVEQNAKLFSYSSGRRDFQEWLIVPVGGNSYKILSRADPNLALTATGNGGNGESMGTEIKVKPLNGDDPDQLWKIESGGLEMPTSQNVYNIRTISSATEFVMNVGDSNLSFCCPITAYGDTAKWNIVYWSDYYDVVTISNDGEVTALKAGEATLLVDVSGAEEYYYELYEFDISVVLNNGVFTISNDSTQIKGSYEENYRLSAYDSAVADPDLHNRYFKYKINKLSDGSYSIRSMLDNSMGWVKSGSSINLADIGTSNTSVPNNAKWNITWDENGYYIRPVSDLTVAVTCSDFGSGELTLSSFSNDELQQMWSLEVSEYIHRDITIVDPVHMIFAGETVDFNAAMYSSDPLDHGSGYNFYWSVSNTSVATIDQSTGLLSALQAGEVTVSVRMGQTSESTYLNKSSTVFTVLPIEGGEMFIRNASSSKKMIQLDYKTDTDTVYTSNGSKVRLGARKLALYQQWNVQYIESGYYKIISSMNGKALTVPSGSENVANAKIIWDSYTEDYRQQWKIISLSDGKYAISPRSNTNFYLISSGTYVVQNSVTANSNYKWEFEPVGEAADIISGDIYNLQRVNSNMVVDVEGGATENMTNISQYTLTPGYQWQRWQINYIGNGEYKIKDINSEKLLSIAASSGNINANVHLWEDDGTTGQIFRIRQNADGTYTFLSKCSNYTKAISLDLYNSDAPNNFIQYYDENRADQKFNLIERNNAIIIVPGFGGSVLQMGENFPLNDVWSNNDVFSGERFEAIFSEFEDASTEIKALWDDVKDLNGDFDFNSLQNDFVIDSDFSFAMESAVLLFGLICNSSGESVFDLTPKPFNPLYGGDDVYGVFNTYETLYNNLKKSVIGSKKSTAYSNYDINFFTYDWRMSCADSADLLDEFIERYEYDSVVLVCHSMGGLVGSAYMAIDEYQREKVEKYVSYGTPHWGTTIAPVVCLTGRIDYFFGKASSDTTWWEDIGYSLITEVIVQYVLAKFPSVYEAFPTAQYINATGGYLKYEDEELCTTYSSTKAVIASHMKGYNSLLMSSAEEFHNSLYIGNQHVTNFTDRVLVYSNALYTVRYVMYDPIIGRFFWYSVSTSVSGDSIVPSVSATMNFESESQDVSGNIDHMEIIDDCSLFSLIFYGV